MSAWHLLRNGNVFSYFLHVGATSLVKPTVATDLGERGGGGRGIRFYGGGGIQNSAQFNLILSLSPPSHIRYHGVTTTRQITELSQGACHGSQVPIATK